MILSYRQRNLLHKDAIMLYIHLVEWQKKKNLREEIIIPT